MHAPGYRLSDEEIAEILPVVLRCHGRAAEAVRANVKGARVSFAACGEYYYPSEENEELIAKTAEYNFNQSSPYGCSWFLDPIFLGKFPEKFEQDFPKVAGSFTPSDFKSVRNSVDYLGFNFYTAAKTALDERGNLKIAENEAGCPVTAMDWPVRETSFYWMLKFLYARYGAPLIIFENGAACNDWVALDGKVHDEARIDYLKRHINAMERAKNEGVDIRGYFVWSLLDNFEWSFGFKPRFGLVYVDYETQKRTIKESGYWYSEFIRNVR
ncbi:MAG: glycoside hydrolase family 1 protein [Candidatus Gallimonas sp.]